MNAGLVLSPGGPDLLASWVHHNHLGVTSCVSSCNITVDDFRINLAVVGLEDTSDALVV